MNEGLEPRCNVASATTRRPGTDFYLFSVVNLRIKEKGVFLMEKKSATSRLVIMAFLIAMEIILTRFCSINTPILRIGFGFLPVAMMGIMFGPVWAAAGYAIGDLSWNAYLPVRCIFPRVHTDSFPDRSRFSDSSFTTGRSHGNVSCLRV